MSRKSKKPTELMRPVIHDPDLDQSPARFGQAVAEQENLYPDVLSAGDSIPPLQLDIAAPRCHLSRCSHGGLDLLGGRDEVSQQRRGLARAECCRWVRPRQLHLHPGTPSDQPDWIMSRPGTASPFRRASEALV